jgi:hypothetical protein
MSKLKGISQRELAEIEDEHEYLTSIDKISKQDLEEQQRITDEADYQQYLKEVEWEIAEENRRIQDNYEHSWDGMDDDPSWDWD